MDISALQSSGDIATTNKVSNSPSVTTASTTSETKDKYSSKLAEIASRYDVTKITPRQMLAMSQELYDNKLISETDYMFMSFQPEVWDPNAPQTYPGPKKLGPDDARDFLAEWKDKQSYQPTALCASNAQNVVNDLEKIAALPHDQVVASSASNGLDSNHVNVALTSEIRGAVEAYKKGISDSTLDTEKMIKLLEALQAHRKPAGTIATTHT